MEQTKEEVRKLEYEEVYGMVKQKLNGKWIVGELTLCDVEEHSFLEVHWYDGLSPYQQNMIDRNTRKLPKGLQD